jgi:hypothetical protein
MAKRIIADRQIELGRHLYLFESPAAGITDCLIIAHGASSAEHRFRVPNGTTVYFKAGHNQAANLADGPIFGYDGHNFSGDQHFNHAHNQMYGAGRDVPDQILGKAHGDHWDDPAQRGPAEYYLAIRSWMNQVQNVNHAAWLPHLVTIRNRKMPFMKDYVWLSRVIELVQAHDPTIVNFYSMACRGAANAALLKKVGDPAFRV